MSSDARRQEEPSKLLTVCPYILGCELGERLAYYGLASNLVNYFKELGASSATSAASVNAWTGFCYFFPLFGGWIADSYLGRFMTILIFSSIYLVGSLILTGSAAIPGIKVEDDEDANGGQWMLLVLSLLLLALGSGGIKPNVSSFGADQFDDTKERDRNDKKSFFNWFYMFINIGALVASTVIVYIQDHGMWELGFAIPSQLSQNLVSIGWTVFAAAALFVAVVLFIAGKPKYKISRPSISPIERFFKVTSAAIRNRRKKRSGHSDAPEGDSSSVPLIEGSNERPAHWLDRAIGPDDFTEEQVKEVKLVYGVAPVFLTSIIYWLVYLQIFGLFILQGNQMDRSVSIFTFDFKMPSASMTSFNTVSIIILIPVYELLVLPGLKRYFNYKPSLLQRIGAGYFVAFIAMISAYLIEYERMKKFDEGKFRPGKDDDDGEIVKLSIWWQILEYGLVGASEVLASIGLLEFFYDQAPDSMRSMMSAVNLIGTSLGGYLSSVLLIVVNDISAAAGSKWITDNLNHGHLGYFFLLISGIMFVTFLLFIWIAMCYKYKDIIHAEPGSTEVNEQLLNDNLGRSIAYHGEPPRSSTAL